MKIVRDYAYIGIILQIVAILYDKDSLWLFGLGLSLPGLYPTNEGFFT